MRVFLFQRNQSHDEREGAYFGFWYLEVRVEGGVYGAADDAVVVIGWE